MSTADGILERLRLAANVSLKLNLTPAELAGLNRLDDVAGLDSLTVLEFLAAVEREFGLSIAPDHLQGEFLADLPALADYIWSQVGEEC